MSFIIAFDSSYLSREAPMTTLTVVALVAVKLLGNGRPFFHF